MKSKYIMTLFFVVAFIHYISANLAHPVTPTLIVNLRLPSYMFGAAYAAMAFTSFLFSPFWAKMRTFYPAKSLLLVGCLGYALGQYLFSISTSAFTIILARCTAGFFVGAIGVSTLIYITEMSEPGKTGANLAKFTIIQALGGALGFLIGGSIGLYSIPITFYVQSALIALSGSLFYLLMEVNTTKDVVKLQAKNFIREINPVNIFIDSKVFMTKNFALLFTVVSLAYLATSSFDQSFNYYIKAEFDFTPIYNGVLKAMIGLITLILNATISVWILGKQKIWTASAGILSLCTLSILLVLGIEGTYLFLIMSLVFYGFNSISVPLLQDSIARAAKSQTRNMVMGFYNSVRFLGMICGALIAGFIYDFGPKLPFVLAAACYALASFLLLAGRKQEKASRY